MIGGFAAVVIQDHGAAQQPRHDDRRQRREEERRIGGRKHVNDVGPPQLAKQQRPVAQLGEGRPRELDPKQPPQRRRREGVDRNEPRLDVGVAPPAIEHPLRLDCLATKDAERCCDDRDAQATMWFGGHKGRARPFRGVECKAQARSYPRQIYRYAHKRLRSQTLQFTGMHGPLRPCNCGVHQPNRLQFCKRPTSFVID